MSDQNMFNHPEFRRHGYNYMHALADVVDNIDDLGGQISDRLMVLGARHAAIPNFQLDYFKVFVRATLNTWEGVLGEEYTEEVRYVWTILLDFVVKLMIEGCLIYDEEGTCSHSSNVSLHSPDMVALYSTDYVQRSRVASIVSGDNQQPTVSSPSPGLDHLNSYPTTRHRRATLAAGDLQGLRKGSVERAVGKQIFKKIDPE